MGEEGWGRVDNTRERGERGGKSQPARMVDEGWMLETTSSDSSEKQLCQPANQPLGWVSVRVVFRAAERSTVSNPPSILLNGGWHEPPREPSRLSG